MRACVRACVCACVCVCVNTFSIVRGKHLGSFVVVVPFNYSFQVHGLVIAVLFLYLEYYTNLRNKTHTHTHTHTRARARARARNSSLIYICEDVRGSTKMSILFECFVLCRNGIFCRCHFHSFNFVMRKRLLIFKELQL